MKTFFILIIFSCVWFLTSIDYSTPVVRNNPITITTPDDYLLDEPVNDNHWKYMNEFKARFSPADIKCLQQNIYFEARNQSRVARIAVAWVTFNRVNSPRYKNTICDVVYSSIYRNGVHRCAFSWYCDGLPDTPKNNKVELHAWEESRKIAENMIRNCFEDDGVCPEDPTRGAVFYFNPKLANPAWVVTKVKTASIDDHDFYRHAD